MRTTASTTSTPRLGIVAELTPDLENYTLAYYSHSFGNGYGGKVVACNTAFNNAVDPRGPLSRAACAQIARANARGDGTWETDVNNPDPFINLQQWSVINTTTLSASDTLTIKNIFSYTQSTEASNYQLYSDNFTLTAGSGVPAASVGLPIRTTNLDTVPGQNSATAQDFTEELQFQGQTSNGALKWQAGGYLERSTPLGWTSTNSASSLNCIDASTLNCTNPLYPKQSAHGRHRIGIAYEAFLPQHRPLCAGHFQRQRKVQRNRRVPLYVGFHPPDLGVDACPVCREHAVPRVQRCAQLFPNPRGRPTPTTPQTPPPTQTSASACLWLVAGPSATRNSIRSRAHQPGCWRPISSQPRI